MNVLHKRSCRHTNIRRKCDTDKNFRRQIAKSPAIRFKSQKTAPKSPLQVLGIVTLSTWRSHAKHLAFFLQALGMFPTVCRKRHLFSLLR